jgi:enoyl-CoA hydratase/carnithine racemase
VVLAANGPSSAPAHDLKELTVAPQRQDGGRVYFHHIMTTCSAMMQSMSRSRSPYIAAVRASRRRQAVQLVATVRSCGSPRGREVRDTRRGYRPVCSTPMVALSRNVTRKQAMHMLLTGEPISAEQAERAGLINRVAEPGRERAEALALAGKRSRRSPRMWSRLARKPSTSRSRCRSRKLTTYAAKVMTENMMARDANEGICAFIEKRSAALGRTS